MKILTQFSLPTVAFLATALLASAQIAPSGIFRSPTPTPAPTPLVETKPAPAATSTPTPTPKPQPIAAQTPAPIPTPTATETPANVETPTARDATTTAGTPAPRPSETPAATRTVRSTPAVRGTPAAADEEETPTATGGSAESKLRQVEQEWSASSHNAATIERLLADDFIGVTSNGAIVTKKAMLKAAREAKDSASSIARMDVRLHGSNLAVVVGTAKETSRDSGGRKSTASFRFTDTWTSRGGTWQCIASHVTELSSTGDRAATSKQRWQTGSHLPRNGN